MWVPFGECNLAQPESDANMSMNIISIWQSVAVIADRIQRHFERKTSTTSAHFFRGGKRLADLAHRCILATIGFADPDRPAGPTAVTAHGWFARVR
jgi:hypothetical protein